MFRPTEPLPLHHSWAMLDCPQRFDLGWVDDAPMASGSFDDALLARRGIGRWDCELAANALTWSPQVYDIFGLLRDARPSRNETIALYGEESRAAMERLRAYAIRHRRGFTLDAEIRPVTGGARWMRLIAAPVCEGARVVRLTGLKQDVSTLYR